MEASRLVACVVVEKSSHISPVGPREYWRYKCAELAGLTSGKKYRGVIHTT